MAAADFSVPEDTLLRGKFQFFFGRKRRSTHFLVAPHWRCAMDFYIEDESSMFIFSKQELTIGLSIAIGNSKANQH